MQRPLEEDEIRNLRQLVAKLSNAAEARIRNEAAAGEKVRRAAQAVQIAGMGQHQYWETQISQPLKNVCLVMAQELQILPTINNQSGAVTAAEIANKLGSDELLVGESSLQYSSIVLLTVNEGRIMRVLTSVGICDESGFNTYRANALSKIAATRGGQAGVKIWNELLFPIAGQLVPYMREHGFKQFPKRPEEMDPTQYTHGGKMMFEYFKDNTETKQWFDTLMVENRSSNMPWFNIYPFETELGSACDGQPDSVLLVDVGGNRGADLLEFHQTYPSLSGRLILQDLPETIEAIDSSTMGLIELQPYNFFKPQPVRGAKAYFWRWVLHDFNDDMIRDFLAHTIEAMDKDSKLLIEELVLPDTGVDVKSSHLDILMMLYHSGMERSESQWRSLLESLGLQVVKIWKRIDADPSVIECMLR